MDAEWTALLVETVRRSDLDWLEVQVFPWQDAIPVQNGTRDEHFHGYSCGSRLVFREGGCTQVGEVFRRTSVLNKQQICRLEMSELAGAASLRGSCRFLLSFLLPVYSICRHN
ncbi:unnamed protein product [Caenorhabditis auriculariae]|uniref:Uncharacterized protein n=1 Tax=Caenorhabditis auriculariae TaxID=2777116 RepID=A0A8S1H6F6_9PELO|nr:unnamed protein product [Caenorhabditis auriculariae]